MKKIFTLIVALGFALIGLYAQESYTALFVPGSLAPDIDGVIEDVWGQVEIVPVAKVPENDGITVPAPDAEDFYAEFGMMWDNSGLYFIFNLTDDETVIVEDYYTDNEIEADMWWKDDNHNLLFSKDLFNETFEQFEFAWQQGVDQEEKLSSDLWANPALIEGDLVESAWYNDETDETMWTLEAWISWEAFGDGSISVGPDDVIYCEVRARDDDDTDSWESMYQWSTTNYGVESDGVGMGAVTLSDQEVALGVDNKIANNFNAVAYSTGNQGANLKLQLDTPSDVQVEIFDVVGKLVSDQVFANLNAGNNELQLGDVFTNGIYLIKVTSEAGDAVVKYIHK